MNVNCVLTNTTYGPIEGPHPPYDLETDCVRNFTCQSLNAQPPDWGYFDVTCPGKMSILNYTQNITYSWSCTMYSDGCVYTYSYDEPTTIAWTENGPCGMPNGRSCCPDDSFVIT